MLHGRSPRIVIGTGKEALLTTPALIPPPTSRPPPALPALTGLRFIAALAVVLAHYQALIAYPPGLREILGQGGAGVGLFFLLSGFVLVYNYLPWFRHDLARIGQFARARVARIVPMYLVAFVLMTPLTLYRLRGQLPAEELVGSWLANLLLVQAFLPAALFHQWNLPAWSLSAEAFFYLLFPFFVHHVLGRCRGRRSLLMLGAVLGAAEGITWLGALGYYQALPAVPDEYFFSRLLYSPVLRVWEFLIGCTVGALFLHAGQHGPGRLGAVLGRPAVRGRLLLLVLAALLGLTWALGLMGWTWPLYVAYTPLFVALLAVLVSGPTFLSPVLEHPLLIRLGEASYALYIIHWLPFVALIVLFPTDQARPAWLSLLVIVAIVATVAASRACYIFIERPAQRRLRGPRPQPAIPATERWPAVAGEPR